MRYLITLLLLFVCAKARNHFDVDPLKTIVWGPGLRPAAITMRARYFFLQLVDLDGRNLTKSPGENIVTGQVYGHSFNNVPCRIWTQIFDCKDGSFIVRYKVFNTCSNINIKVKIKGKELSLPHSEIKGPVYEEECYCPNPSIINWLYHYQCRQNYTQIHDDLSPFLNIDFDQIRQSIIKRYDQPTSVSICHYVLKSNRIYRHCYGQYVGFKIFMDAILLSLVRKVVLPDIEFFVNLGDWPLVPDTGPLYPIFSWCGSGNTKDIVMPTYDITESSMEAMGRVMLDTLSVQGNTGLSWENKTEQLFWRGRDSRRERLDLIDISRKHPELFNVSITNFFFFRDEMDKYGPTQNHVSFFNFFKYKYQLNIDGTVAAYRFPYLLAGDSLVFKQESNYYEFFYKDLIPGLHYVPVKSDLSDLVEKIMWAKGHDEDGLKIVKSARQFARDNLLPRDILCYYTVLFHEWSKRLKSKVEILDNMEEVPQPSHSCQCHFSNLNFRDEL
ncbi:protein O-glucosyltransferase 2-like isoform X1 [Formica exsecta]|uniref:protein O-glucosyltransferase 2-like isoform X1 n=1 Tax=Formica exsecta TaxID=72781 RepID=UPI0011416F96|nr:protein O-glucosyltransferase 2-like isoform X1 [Formica exsecta]XP_029663411.1 protein O-glucosyltransferase 2-like isoform X2 [Formica exsecta]XP_029663412.1 protein O-glucosyltransferase 2-like isoform X1 [Formica exsecta]